MPVTPGAGTPPVPHIKMLTVVSSGAADKLVQQRAKQQNTTSITASPAPEESTSQIGDRVTEAARAATIVRPDPLTPPVATAPNPIATPTGAPIEGASTASVQPTSDARTTVGDAEDTAKAGASINSASGAMASIVSEPVEMCLVAVLGLAMAGLLFRIAMTVRRRRIFIDRPESHWMNDWNEHELNEEQQHAGSFHQREELIDDFINQPESHWMDDRNEHKLHDRQQPSGSVHQWDKKLIDDLQRSSTASDYKPRRPLRNDYQSQENPQRRDRDSDVADEISKPEEMLELLRRDLDQLLGSPKGGVAHPRATTLPSSYRKPSS
jgi:hypothetical protein